MSGKAQMNRDKATPQSRPEPASPEQTEQDSHGNAFVAGMLGSAITDLGLDSWFGQTPEEKAIEEQKDFLTKTWPAAADFDTGTGGNFDGELVGDQLNVTLKVAFDFLAGDPSTAPVGTPANELQWSSDLEAIYRAEFLKTVAGAWSNVHRIRSTLPLWTTTVGVNVTVIEDSSDPHFRVRVHKLPFDAGDGPASVCDRAFHHDAAYGACDPNAPGDNTGSAVLDSRDNSPTRVRTGSQGLFSVYFEQGGDQLKSGEDGRLTAPAADLVANPAWTVELTGHASAEGQAESNFELARDRITTVADEIGGYGIDQSRVLRDNQGEDGAAANDPLERCVDVFVVDVDNQVTSAHEAGHMFGLTDEYSTGTDVAGDPLDASYQKLIRENADVSGGMPTKGATDSILSNGMDVETWHYAPFVALLKQITGSDKWTV